MPVMRLREGPGLGLAHLALHRAAAAVVDLGLAGWGGLLSLPVRLRCVWDLGDGGMRRKRASTAMVLEALTIITVIIIAEVSKITFLFVFE